MKIFFLGIIAILFISIFPLGERVCGEEHFSPPDPLNLLLTLATYSKEDLLSLCQSQGKEMEKSYLQGEYPQVLSQAQALLFAGALLGNSLFQADAQYYKAQVLSRQGKDEEALRELYKAYFVYEQLMLPEKMIRALEVMIRITENVNLWEEAQRYLKDLQNLYQASQNEYGKLVFLLNQGVIAYQEGKYEEARTAWQEVANTDPDFLYPEITGLAINHLSHIALSQGEAKTANDLLNKVLRVAQERNLSWVEFVVRLSLSQVLTDYFFEYEQALENLARAQELINKMDLTYQRLWVLNNFSVIYTQMGEYGKAKEILEEALFYQQEAGIPDDLGIIFNLGVLSWYLGKEEEAEKYFNRALALARSQRERKTEALCLSNLGMVYKARQDFSSSITFYQQALSIFEELGLEIETAGLLNNLANLNLALGAVKEADEALNLALSIYEKHEFSSGITQVFINQGYIALQKGEKVQASSYFEKACNKTQTIQDPSLTFYALLGQGEAYLQEGRRKEAVSTWEEAIQILEDTRGKMEDVTDRTCFLDDRLEVYDLLIEEYFREGRYEDAFNLSERVKARSFLDVVAGQSLKVKPEDQELWEKIRKLQGEKEAREAKRIEVSQKPPTQENQLLLWQLDKEIEEVTVKLNNLTEDYHNSSPELLSFATVHPLPLSEIQKNLEEGAVLLVYHVLPHRTLAWVISKSSLVLKDIEVGEGQLKDTVLKAREKISDYDSTDFAPPLEELYQYLIYPLEDKLAGAKSVVIIPHKFLSYLPFQALIRKEHFLLEDYIFSYAPSANAYLFSLQKRKEDSSTFLGLANPFFSDPSLPSLPGSEEEVKTIAPLFSQAKIYLGKEATETTFYQYAPLYSVIHLSTHALADEKFPLYSLIALAEDEENDGYLLAAEALKTPLSANLVVLSACQTALGQYSESEGLVGFTRSFFYAGAPTLIVSLWSVSDQATSELFIQFYKYWKKGYCKAEALQMAQKDLVLRYQHPGYWAPFILSGSTK